MTFASGALAKEDFCLQHCSVNIPYQMIAVLVYVDTKGHLPCLPDAIMEEIKYWLTNPL